jgi:hypothetical protein
MRGKHTGEYFLERLRGHTRSIPSGRDTRARLVSLDIDAKGPAGERLSMDIAWFGGDSSASYSGLFVPTASVST